MIRNSLALCLVALFLSNNTVTRAQITYLSDGHRVESILPSTEGVALIKSVERQPSLAFGIPNIYLPLHSFDGTGLQIGLSYNPSGIQVDELPTVVGTGWRLETGGRITRVVLGYPDDYTTIGYLNRSTTLDALSNKLITQFTTADLEFLSGIDLNAYDDCPDVFYYDVMGIKGKFVLDRNGSVYCYPRNNLKFSFEKNTTTGEIKKFTVKFSNGEEGVFDMKETVTTSITNMTNQFTSSWLLTQIKDDDNISIAWNYINYSNGDNGNYKYRESRIAYDQTSLGNTGVAANSSASYTADFILPRLLSISTANCLMTFTYQTSLFSGFATNLGRQWPRITEIDIKFTTRGYGAFDSPLNVKYKLSYSKTSGEITSKNDLLLTKLQQTNATADVSIPYEFEYYQGSLVNPTNKGRDLWGYPNGQSNTSSIVPSLYGSNGKLTFLPFSPLRRSGANRVAVFSSLVAGTLKAIRNPDGLKTVYYYGLNWFNYEGTDIAGNGLRVDSVMQYDFEDNLLESTTYSYTKENSTATSGTLIYHNSPVIGTNIDDSDPITTGIWTNKNALIKASYHGTGILPYSSQSFYRKVTVSKNGMGKSSFYFELPVERVNPSIFPPSLEWSLSTVNTVRLSQDENTLVLFNQTMSSMPSPFNLWNSPFLVLSQDMNSAGTVVRKVKNTYGTVQLEVVKHGLKFYPVYRRSYKIDGVPYVDYYYHASKIYQLSSWRDLLKTVETVYDLNGNNGDSTIREFSFVRPENGFDYSFVKRAVSYSVSNEKSISKYKYCFEPDFVVAEEAAINTYNQALSTCLQSKMKPYPTLDTISEERIEECYEVYNLRVNNLLKPEVKAIKLLKTKGNFSAPIEQLTMLEKGSRKVVTGYKFSILGLLENGQVMPLRNYELRFPVDSNLFHPIQIAYSNGYKLNYDSTQYNYTSAVTKYGARGEVLEYITADSVYHARIYETNGKGIRLQCDNCRYESVKNYTGGEDIIRQSNPAALITTQSTIYPLGATRVTDPRGRTSYSIYNTLGQVVATRDHNRNLRAVSISRIMLQQGESQIISSTDPLRDSQLTNEWIDPGNMIAIPTQSGTYDVSAPLSGTISYNPAYSWTINYGDGVTENIASSSFSHKYSDTTILYSINLKCKKYDQLVAEKTVTAKFAVKQALLATYLFTYIPKAGTSYTSSSTCPTLAEELEIKVTAKYGFGNYTASWTVVFTPEGSSTPVSNSYNVNFSPSGKYTTRTFNQEGTYSVTLNLKDNGQVRQTKTWNFRIDYGIPKPKPEIEI